jgi:hypothetical protein
MPESRIDPNQRSSPDDWETITLSRIAAHVGDLPPLPEEAEDFGWEEGVLQLLRKRLADAD